MFVTVDTELHVEILSLDAIHGFHRSVALLAGDFLFDVPLVVKQHVLGQIVGLFPGCRGLGVVIAVFLQDLRMPRNDVVVAVQAFFHRRQPGMLGVAHVGVAVFALDVFDPGMHPMAEGYRLLHADVETLLILRSDHQLFSDAV